MHSEGDLATPPSKAQTAVDAQRKWLAQQMENIPLTPFDFARQLWKGDGALVRDHQMVGRSPDALDEGAVRTPPSARPPHIGGPFRARSLKFGDDLDIARPLLLLYGWQIAGCARVFATFITARLVGVHAHLLCSWTRLIPLAGFVWDHFIARSPIMCVYEPTTLRNATPWRRVTLCFIGPCAQALFLLSLGRLLFPSSVRVSKYTLVVAIHMVLFLVWTAVASYDDPGSEYALLSSGSASGMEHAHAAAYASLFTTEHTAPLWLHSPIAFAVGLLDALPSTAVAYGVAATLGCAIGVGGSLSVERCRSRRGRNAADADADEGQAAAIRGPRAWRRLASDRRLASSPGVQ